MNQKRFVTHLAETTLSIFPELSWDKILIRSGFNIKTESGQHVSLDNETNENIAYLQKIVAYGHFGAIEGKAFIPATPHIQPLAWLNAVDACYEGSGGGQADELFIMDTYMAGVVRWLSCIGFVPPSVATGTGNARRTFVLATQTRRALRRVF